MAVDNKDPLSELEEQAEAIARQQRDLAEQEAELMKVPQFASFLDARKQFESSQALIFDSIQHGMEAANVKSIKGDWGSITLAERASYSVEDVNSLPEEFVKLTADVKAIGENYKLTGELPAGVEERKTRYLLKRFK